MSTDEEPHEPDPAYQLYQQARDAMDAREFEMAISLFEQSIALSPHFKSLELLGACFMKLGRYREAIVPLAAATGLNQQANAPLLLAKTFYELRELSHARSMVRCALERNQNLKAAQELKIVIDVEWNELYGD